MKSITLCALLALATAAWAVSPPERGTAVDCSRQSRNICLFIYKPICGTDGITHGNECMLCFRNQQLGYNIRKLHDGECTASSPSTPSKGRGERSSMAIGSRRSDT